MARRRYVSTDISDDDGLAELVAGEGYFVALLYTWLIPHADDQGSFSGNPRKLLSMVTPQLALIKGKWRVKETDIIKALEAMKDAGMIVTEGDHYYFPPRVFYRYQTYISAANRRKEAPDEDISALRGENAEEQREITLRGENATSVSVSSSVSVSPSVDVVDRACASFASFGKVTAGTANAVEWSVKDYGIDWVERAIRDAAGAGFDDRPPWGYVESILERWKKQGKPDDEMENADGRAQEPVRNGSSRRGSRSPVGVGVSDGSDVDRYLAGID